MSQDPTWTDLELPGMPDKQPGQTPYEAVVESTRVTLGLVRDEIVNCVNRRAEINERVKGLRADEDRLARMLRIAESAAKPAPEP